MCLRDAPELYTREERWLSCSSVLKERSVMSRLGILAIVLFACSMAAAQDPIRTDGEKYKVLLENEKVRVLEYRDHPGEKTQQHAHPAFVLYVVSPFKRKLTLPDGKAITREFTAGEVFWSESQTHVGENIGDTPTHVIMIEMKR
jgi:hypothetical protein